ncbi:MAG TPA: alpha/beta hydrolase [Steroidobacter sp.]|jgi:acetyl esterase|nr:alpha/beta hydrolase [Steroidobacter sp.]
MVFVHPRLRPLIEASRGQPTLADVSIEQARAQIALRTASRPRGPAIETVRDLRVPGPRGDIALRLYRPPNPAGIVMAFHGGGWLMGSLDSFDATCRHVANDSGLAVVSVDYRLAPEFVFPAALDDAWAATQWVAKNGAALNVDAPRMTVLGESAGGNLAAVVCLLARDAGFPRIALQALVYPAVDARLDSESLEQFAEGFLQTRRDVFHAFGTYALNHGVDATDWRLSPLLAPSHAELPAAVLISAEVDAVRDDTDAYTQKLSEAGVDAVHVRYAGMLHTFFGMRGIVREAEYAQKQVAKAMRDAVEGLT